MSPSFRHSSEDAVQQRASGPWTGGFEGKSSMSRYSSEDKVQRAKELVLVKLLTGKC